jgi:hypothetical protein
LRWSYQWTVRHADDKSPGGFLDGENGWRPKGSFKSTHAMNGFSFACDGAHKTWTASFVSFRATASALSMMAAPTVAVSASRKPNRAGSSWLSFPLETAFAH